MEEVEEEVEEEAEEAEEVEEVEEVDLFSTLFDLLRKKMREWSLDNFKNSSDISQT